MKAMMSRIYGAFEVLRTVECRNGLKYRAHLSFPTPCSSCRNLDIGEVFAEQTRADSRWALKVASFVAGEYLIFAQGLICIRQDASYTALVKLQMFSNEAYSLFPLFDPRMVLQQCVKSLSCGVGTGILAG